MEHEKQVEVVKQALELETQIQVLEQFLPEERAETYAEPEPRPPVRQEAHYAEPPIRHGCKVNWLLMLGPAGITLALSTFSNSAFLVWMFALTLFVWVPVYYFALYRKKRRQPSRESAIPPNTNSSARPPVWPQTGSSWILTRHTPRRRRNMTPCSCPGIKRPAAHGKRSIKHKSEKRSRSWPKQRRNWRRSTGRPALFRHSTGGWTPCSTSMT